MSNLYHLMCSISDLLQVNPSVIFPDLLEVHCTIDLSGSFVGFNQCNIYRKELKEKFKTFKFIYEFIHARCCDQFDLQYVCDV